MKIEQPSGDKSKDKITNIDDLLKRSPRLSKLFEEDDTEYEINLENKKLISHGHEYSDIPRMRSLIRVANIIRDTLPHVPEGYIRLWRGNRPGEVGENPSFTNSLEGIALPFLKSYEGQLSFVDVPEDIVKKSLVTSGGAKNSEFILPLEIASGAQTIEESLGITPEVLKLYLEYANQNKEFDKKSFEEWLNSE